MQLITYNNLCVCTALKRYASWDTQPNEFSCEEKKWARARGPRNDWFMIWSNYFHRSDRETYLSAHSFVGNISFCSFHCVKSLTYIGGKKPQQQQQSTVTNKLEWIDRFVDCGVSESFGGFTHFLCVCVLHSPNQWHNICPHLDATQYVWRRTARHRPNSKQNPSTVFSPSLLLSVFARIDTFSMLDAFCFVLSFVALILKINLWKKTSMFDKACVFEAIDKISYKFTHPDTHFFASGYLCTHPRDWVARDKNHLIIIHRINGASQLIKCTFCSRKWHIHRSNAPLRQQNN